MDATSDRVTHLRWKARESRAAARLVADGKGRLALLKMAQIYERLAAQLTQSGAGAELPVQSPSTPKGRAGGELSGGPSWPK